jgi:hypothetical protein
MYFRYVLYRAVFFLVYGRTKKKMARRPLPNCLGKYNLLYLEKDECFLFDMIIYNKPTDLPS